jgi:hypothetical protein
MVRPRHRSGLAVHPWGRRAKGIFLLSGQKRSPARYDLDRARASLKAAPKLNSVAESYPASNPVSKVAFWALCQESFSPFGRFSSGTGLPSLPSLLGSLWSCRGFGGFCSCGNGGFTALPRKSWARLGPTNIHVTAIQVLLV